MSKNIMAEFMACDKTFVASTGIVSEKMRKIYFIEVYWEKWKYFEDYEKIKFEMCYYLYAIYSNR